MNVAAVIARICAVVFMFFLFVFMFAPMVVVAVASFSSGERPYVSFPPDELSIDWYLRIPGRYLQTLMVTFGLATISALAASALGIMAALALVRGSFPGKQIFAAVLRVPLQIPFVVTGIAFLQLYYLIGAATGLHLRDSFPGLVIGHMFLTTPYVIGSVSAVLMRFNKNVEEAAQSLGASKWRTFRRVTLPIIMPGVYAGALYAFIISFGELPVALFLSGASYTTFPVEMYTSMQFDFNPSLLAVSTLILILSLGFLLLLQRVVGLDALLKFGAGRH